jgi:hypothetical protein
MPANKGRPTPTRKAAQTRQRERGEGLRSWLRDRAAVLIEAQNKRREEHAEQQTEDGPAPTRSRVRVRARRPPHAPVRQPRP